MVRAYLRICICVVVWFTVKTTTLTDRRLTTAASAASSDDENRNAGETLRDHFPEPDRDTAHIGDGWTVETPKPKQKPTAPPAEYVTELSAATFSVARGVPVSLITFYAPWCAHCKSMLPGLEDLALKAQAGNVPVVVARMDATASDAEKKLASELGVDKFPTTLILVRGALKATLVGVRSSDDLQDRLDEHLASLSHTHTSGNNGHAPTAAFKASSPGKSMSREEL